jgi:hypothetical protein
MKRLSFQEVSLPLVLDRESDKDYSFVSHGPSLLIFLGSSIHPLGPNAFFRTERTIQDKYIVGLCAQSNTTYMDLDFPCFREQCPPNLYRSGHELPEVVATRDQTSLTPSTMRKIVETRSLTAARLCGQPKASVETHRHANDKRNHNPA